MESFRLGNAKASKSPKNERTPDAAEAPDAPCESTNQGPRQQAVHGRTTVLTDDENHSSLRNAEKQIIQPDSTTNPSISTESPEGLCNPKNRPTTPHLPSQNPMSVLPHPSSTTRAVYNYNEPLLDYTRTGVEDTQANTTRNLCMMLDDVSARGTGAPVQYPATTKPSPKNANKNVRFDRLEVCPDPDDIEPEVGCDPWEVAIDEEFRRMMQDALEEIRDASLREEEDPEGSEELAEEFEGE